MTTRAKKWRLAVAAVAAGAAVLGAATSAQAYSGFTPERYRQIQFGMTKDQVWQIGGGSQACETGGLFGDSVMCWAESSDYAPYGGFSFTADGRMREKRSEFLLEVRTPSVTLAQYDGTRLGMTEAQVWSVVSEDSCVLRREGYPNWPATNGHVEEFYCTAANGLFPPDAHFTFTDGGLTARRQYHLS
ncbi:BLIP family protein [Streptomyces sp. NPDC060011]|uniref:BLIP family protein n=1 Tax=unclassified Streptomyces TaxID=2593676 RepID=UPI002259CA93|nr:BLIP family protein [Streptomyces sp. NBC_00198]MCX5283142.1 BLIP family protein [Streptomyces sp. NBC_00198]